MFNSILCIAVRHLPGLPAAQVFELIGGVSPLLIWKSFANQQPARRLYLNQLRCSIVQTELRDFHNVTHLCAFQMDFSAQLDI